MLVKAHGDEYLFVADSSSQYTLPMDNIISISLNSHNAVVNASDGEHVLRITATELMRLLPGCFLRCHRSHIVNLSKISGIYKNSIQLCDGSRLPLSRANAKVVKDAFLKLHTAP